ncbi:MAG: hypothetical protein KF900_09395 [Bacteroidetes bacterium]|nr:hypothetical protein [Bacteroidota bacterium]
MNNALIKKVIQRNIKAASTTPKTKEQGMSLKEKIVYSVLAALGLGGLVLLGKKAIDRAVSNKAHSKSFEDGTPETLAKQIKMAFENDGWWGTDTEALRRTLISIKSKDELNKVFKAYQKEYNRNMYKDMSDELQASEYNEMLQIIAGKPEKTGQAINANQYIAWAKRLKAAFDKTYGFIPGTDEKAIRAVFTEIPTQADYVQVGAAYYKAYGEDLTKALKSELEFWEYSDYMNIILAKPKA